MLRIDRTACPQSVCSRWPPKLCTRPCTCQLGGSDLRLEELDEGFNDSLGRAAFDDVTVWDSVTEVMMLRLLPPQPRPPLKVALLSLPMMMMVVLNLSLPHLLLRSRRGLVRIPFETLEHMLMIGRLLHLSCFAPLMVA